MIFYWTSFYTYVNKLHSNSGVFISFIVLNNLKDTKGGITSKSCFRYLNSNPATLQSFQFGSDKILFLFNKMISSYISKTVDNASVFLILICANKTKNKRVPGVVDRKSTRLNSSTPISRMPSSAWKKKYIYKYIPHKSTYFMVWIMM